ncbi:MAG TPA: M20/M25/M40 family metallo-hydrolase [Gemmatimonadales bacterium]|nr:M20/M25/M40 family metallo-hydrolase [Gemmatimonadales bacterium]
MSRRQNRARRAVGGALVLLGLALPLMAQDSSGAAEAAAVVEPLIETYGVSGAEQRVSDEVRRLLPTWAAPVTDSAGNLWLEVGQGDPVVVFIAHQDEIGFRVTAINDDGTLNLEARGGFFTSLYEAEAALVHTDRGDVPGVFMPRDTGFSRREPPPLHVNLGVSARSAAAALGVQVGNTVTMPKQFVRLAGTRASGRSADDRVGCAALILALRHLDRTRLRHEVVFIWSAREETGLEGAAVAAARLGATTRRVHAIDQFVTSDSPVEPENYADAPLGLGPVARALDNSAVSPPAELDSLEALARARGIPLQVGATGGGNDGSVFTPYGAPDVAIGWPTRNAHSPVEVFDLADVAHLADLVQAIAEDW